VNTSLYRSLSYDPIADFAPVSLVTQLAHFVFVPNSLPVHSDGRLPALRWSSRLDCPDLVCPQLPAVFFHDAEVLGSLLNRLLLIWRVDVANEGARGSAESDDTPFIDRRGRGT
jgi:hypothetical protein